MMQDSKDILSCWHEGCRSKSNGGGKPMHALRVYNVAMKAMNGNLKRIEILESRLREQEQLSRRSLSPVSAI